MGNLIHSGVEGQTMTDPTMGDREYLCYQVLKQMDERGRDVPETDFNKFCFLAFKELQEEGVDVDLPVYWYQYGMVVDTDILEDFFIDFIPTHWQSRSGNKAVLGEDVNESDFEVTEARKAKIMEGVSSLVERFASKFGTEHARDYSYEKYADEEFIQAVNKYRSYLQEIDLEDSVSADTNVPGMEISFSEIFGMNVDTDESGVTEEIEERIDSYLRELARTYPKEKFNRMYSPFLQYESVSRMLMRNGQYSPLLTFTNKFWVLFSRIELRVRYNENLPRGKILQWKRQRRDELERVDQLLEEYREMALKNREDTNQLEAVADSYSNSVRAIYQKLTLEKQQ